MSQGRWRRWTGLIAVFALLTTPVPAAALGTPTSLSGQPGLGVAGSEEPEGPGEPPRLGGQVGPVLRDASELPALVSSGLPARVLDVAVGSYESEPGFSEEERRRAGTSEAFQFDREAAVELVEERTADSKVYRNPDGTRTALVFSSEVHVRNGRGE